ncbi:MAG: patatin-like phospholipase family protein [Parvularcula sp.]|nr:patatin-like phospholipase family protein [Parvularcula sp.]
MAITADGGAYQEDVTAFSKAAFERLLLRAERVARGETRDDALDILALSGGADWGAFGAGYLARWSELGDAAALPMPEFDVVAGISTGALIGTYVAAGTLERYAGIEAFYRSTNPDWIKLGGLSSFFPASAALLDNTAIRDAVDEAVDDELVDELRAAHAADRIVAVGTTNLDFANLEFFDLGIEAASMPNPAPRIIDILMAATAIPGAFPPVEIDGDLYADGGAVQGVPGLGPRSLPSLAEVWRERQGDKPLPPLRFWYIFNSPLELAPEAVTPNWFAVVFRSYETVTRTAFKAPLRENILQADVYAAAGYPPLEVRWVAVPGTFTSPEGAKPFDPVVTNKLADLGRSVADRPDGGWRTDSPP